jgi:hypothetical protein
MHVWELDRLQGFGRVQEIKAGGKQMFHFANNLFVVNMLAADKNLTLPSSGMSTRYKRTS